MKKDKKEDEGVDMKDLKTEDPRSIPTMVNLVKNKMRAKGLNMSHQPKGKMVENKTVDPQPEAVKKEEINPFVQSSLEALGSIVKKKSNLDEEGYDVARDMGRVRPSKDKKDGTSYPPSEEMKKTQKVNK